MSSWSQKKAKKKEKRQNVHQRMRILSRKERFTATHLNIFFFFFNYLLCSVVLVSTVQQSESATHIHISLLFCIPFPFGKEVTTVHSVVFLVLYSVFPLVIYFTHTINNVYVSIPLSSSFTEKHSSTSEGSSRVTWDVLLGNFLRFPVFLQPGPASIIL